MCYPPRPGAGEGAIAEGGLFPMMPAMVTLWR
jgi:hypothetical protein